MVSEVLAETFIGAIPTPDVYECLNVQKRTHSETNTSGIDDDLWIRWIPLGLLSWKMGQRLRGRLNGNKDYCARRSREGVERGGGTRWKHVSCNYFWFILALVDRSFERYHIQYII